MKKIFIILILLTTIFSSSQILYAQHTNATASDLNFLKLYKGKYPHDVKLFSNPIIKQRLKKLLRSQFDSLIKTLFQVEIPIKVENNFFYAWGMKAHSGGDPSAIILADINKNILYLEIKEGNRTKIYQEGRGTISKELEDWANKQSKN